MTAHAKPTETITTLCWTGITWLCRFVRSSRVFLGPDFGLSTRLNSTEQTAVVHDLLRSDRIQIGCLPANWCYMIVSSPPLIRMAQSVHGRYDTACSNVTCAPREHGTSFPKRPSIAIARRSVKSICTPTGLFCLSTVSTVTSMH